MRFSVLALSESVFFFLSSFFRLHIIASSCICKDHKKSSERSGPTLEQLQGRKTSCAHDVAARSIMLDSLQFTDAHF